MEEVEKCTAQQIYIIFTNVQDLTSLAENIQ